MTTTLLIARHGNTFEPHETPTRVGMRTDLPLVESGREQARKLGRYLLQNDLVPDFVLTSELKRTRQMAETVIVELARPIETRALPIFNEIDYGPDENKTEAEVIARIGEEAIKAWDANATVPEGWQVEPEALIRHWIDFSNELEAGSTTLVITSNGMARFAPHITGDFEAFRQNHPIKVSTGALCIFERNETNWVVGDWNTRP